MVINARKKSKRRFQLKQAQPFLSSQDIFCEGMTIKSGYPEQNERSRV
ncbi:hypothetical protein LEP1GSC026_1149 [Leptospira interrogans str. 2002000623]|uniref:Uncharacterized protein n=2 Tax=Leptospira interrogans TaxID=173 RepID=A0A829D4M1_LEPIR|nr:hypothetical protein LEP1GSC027_2451 [Leptospira interrogans str. 2002000624]EKQ36995.1 hypothetical protein LEP1GSC025_1368 [Leptospira interrogans str. 2002000621]EKQ46641.1 hypothetical protein LEP1GSC026_1149 [Leptospira interrogans str. 2002000623]EMJ74237.1 hypothetical protein LEP1GSC033_3134 [Leptospira interrogans str. 2002000632]EMY03915.1 hypothetical protein LEP1GSC029_3756 [Leptospira interrogans str. 2002000626]EMY26783.1 hypothetical protein LEP1GSC115_4544 [Leptospira interr